MGLPTSYQQYIHLSRYSRFLHDKGRRETWEETVARYFDFFTNHLKENHKFNLTPELRAELESAVLNLEVMPSMRAIMTAGPALEKDNIAGYNCSYVAIDGVKSFAEVLHILMNGTGVGFSVERQYVNKLPEVPEELFPTDTVIVVSDSKIGWARAFHELLQLLYSGNIPTWDLSKLRPAGAVLKTFGGRSSGPGPLDALFKFVVATVKAARGRKLTSLECHDIVCMTGESVVVGGVRRSALISLSNLSDDRMRNAKSGAWWDQTPHRSLANNSAVYNDKRPAMETFITEWKSLYDSKSGERGIFSRYATKNVIERSNAFRKQYFESAANIRYRDSDHDFGTNPCSEIILRDKEFCNLTETVIREKDTLDDLKRKVRIAAILGTFQSTLVNFRFLSKKWKDNTEDERLLGVSLTGIMDNAITSGSKGDVTLKEWLTEMRKVAIQINMEFAGKLGVEMATAITAIKPSGTVSQLVDSASGIHARHAPYYIRTVRADKKDPLGQAMIEMGFPVEDDQMRPDHNLVFSFPMKSPKNAIFREDMTAIEQLALWKLYQMYWCEHKPSVTITVKEDEWMAVGAWVFENFEWMSGVSFLPFSDHVYAQAPYQDITKDEYDEWMKKMPKVSSWDFLQKYETSDQTIGAQELACSAGGGCEIL